MKFKTIDLCAGIGGIRKGFELTGCFENISAAETDLFAQKTYLHLYGQDAGNDVTDEEYKKTLEQLPYDILLAGFPCQTFSRAGYEEGFNNPEKGIIFEHIADIINRTRPKAVFMENVDNLVRHNKGETFRIIINTLEINLDYKVVGVTYDASGNPYYDSKAFVRNSKYFGVPQNRPRTYIMAFDRKKYGENLLGIENYLPERNDLYLYDDLNDLLEMGADAHYYMASGYFETLLRHKEREKSKGNGFGYRIVNAPEIQSPVANTIMATGGSGKERNLILDPQDNIGGLWIPGKKTPLNDKGIRVMTPREWGKLQGFIDYAFIDENGEDLFSFPEGLSEAQMYKQFGNAVTIPLIETMAEFMINCFRVLGELPVE